MTSSTTRQRRITAVAVALLAVLCGVLLAKPATASTPGASAAGAAVGAGAAPSATAPFAAVAHPLGDGVGAGRATHHPDTRNSPNAPSSSDAPSSPDVTSAGADGDPDAVADPGRGHGTGTPGCHKSPDDAGSLPVLRSGAQQNQPLLPAERPAPDRYSALSDDHTTPPVRGPSPIRAPGPVDLSVLRV